MIRPFVLALSIVAAPLVACSPDASSPKPVRSTGTAAVGGPFQLVDQTGAPRTQALLEGKWSLVFFGFTNCPDVCPTTLQTLQAAKSRLGRAAEQVQVVLVTVDPDRDTPEALRAYLESDAFPPGTVGLTGTPDQVAAALKAYRVYAKKVVEGDDYTMDHSNVVYLMNPRGELARPLSYGQTAEQMAELIQAAMREG